MKRDFNKLTAEGGEIIKKHERMDMSLSEATALLEKAEPGSITFTLWDAYRAGVAVGLRISKADGTKGKNCAV